MSKKKSKKKQVAADRSENKNLNYILLVIFCIFLIFFTTFKFSGDDDVFWHLATGRYIVENLSVPSQDVFGHQTEGVEWMPFEWGWDVLTYAIHSLSGYMGISAFRTLTFLLMFFVYFRIYSDFKIDFNVTLLFFAITSFGIIDRLTPRPHIISLLFFVILLYIIVKLRYAANTRKFFYYSIPFLFLVWGNMHMGVIAGLMLLGVFYLVTVYEHFRNGSGKMNRTVQIGNYKLLTIIVVLSVLALLINPNGFATYIYAYEHTQMKLLETINEWRSPFDEMFAGSFVTIIYKIFLFCGVIVLYYSFKTKDYFPVILFIVFALYSIRAVRFTVDYIIILTPFIALGFQTLIDNLNSGGLKSFLKYSFVPKVAIGLVLIYCIIRLPGDELYLDDLQYYRISGFGVNNEFMPEQLFDFMKEQSIPEKGEKVLNHFGTGGYYVWNFPGKKNFIDSRNLNDEIFNDYNKIFSKQPGFEKRLEELNPDHLIYLVPDLVRIPHEMETSIVSYLSKSDEWKLVFWDDKSFLFLKDEEQFEGIIEQYAYKYVTPYNFLYSRTKLDEGLQNEPERVKEEIERKKTTEPDGIIINAILQKYNIKF